jgi:2-polyprenyl-3-methyl-5-hydroxy-6-metoxy-1,4-benzoquinol methylase
MNKQELLQKLDILNHKTNEEWLACLEKRKLKELEFHNKHRLRDARNQLSQDTYEKLYGNKKFYSTVKLSSDYVNSWISQHSRGKIFLDYACGNGVNAINAARAGAELAIGLDISDISIKNARKFAEEKGVLDNTSFVQADCEKTGLPNECVDLIICSGVLHRLDLSYAFFELRRY